MAKRKSRKPLARKKEFRYRGYTVQELQAMTLGDFTNLLPARPRRSITRGISEEQRKFLARVKAADKKVIKTHLRDLVVVPAMMGHRIGIHNGREFKVVEILPEMLGHYLGEFALTRQVVKHSGPGVGATKASKYMPLR